MATLPAIEFRIEKIRDDLTKMPNAIFGTQNRVVNLQAELDAAKAEDVADAKVALNEVIASATFEAMTDGRIDGKNQATRDVQLKAILSEDKDVLAAQQYLFEAERLAREIERELAMAQSDLAYAMNTFRAAKYLADLESAQLRSLSVEGE